MRTVRVLCPEVFAGVIHDDSLDNQVSLRRALLDIDIWVRDVQLGI
jgi:hypothetical protein